MKKGTFVVFVMNMFLIMLILLVSLLKVMPANAYSGLLLSAWTSNPPTIDGIIDVDTEWVMADQAPFIIGGSYAGTLYVMNDATNLYLAVRIADDDFGTNTSTRDFVAFFFDADHDGVGPEIGDDSLVCISMSTYLDQFFQDPSYAWDNLNGGTNDGVVGSSGDGIHNEFEISHPLNSTNDAHDFSLTMGDTIGFMIRYADNNAYVGNWPASASPYSNPTDWHEIKIASSIYQGDLILAGNDVFTIVGSFAINGSIIVKDNASLILNDATVNFTQAASHQFNLTLKEPNNGYPKLQISNATLESTYILHVYLYGNSTVSANRLSAYHEMNFFDDSSGNITDSPVLWTVNCYDFSKVRFLNSQLVQMRMRDTSRLLFLESNATNFIEVYNDASINASNSRIRGFGTYNSAQAVIANSTFTYFNDQGSNYASFVNMTYSTITDEFRSWGTSQVIFSNCTISFSDVNSYSAVTYRGGHINGIRIRSSAMVTIKDQCTANGSIIAEENSTLILDHA
ncbi:MAG: hypothetical protein JSV05_03000, partial [Candidatus Bathyarchaeota archaeon]